MSFSLYDSSDLSSLTLETVTTVSGLFPTQKNLELNQPPYSEYTFLAGDGKRRIPEIRLGLMLRGSSKADCEIKLRALRDFAIEATSLRSTKDAVTTYRAVHLNGTYFDNEKQLSPTLLTIDLVLLPKFADWTTTLAESRATFDAATKQMY